MAPPLNVIKGANLLAIIAKKAVSMTKQNKFLAGSVVGGSLSLGIPKVESLAGDTEFVEAIEDQLADGMTQADKDEVMKTVDFIGSMFKDAIYPQPLKDGEQHRYLIIDFRNDSAVLTVNRSRAADTYAAYKRGKESQLLNRNKRRQGK